MSQLLERIKSLKIEAMKTKSTFSHLGREAYDAVLASIDTQKGRGVEITDAVVLETIKKEVKIFKETQSRDGQYLEDCELKAATLSLLLPKQLTTEDLEGIFYTYTYDTPQDQYSPKSFMAYIESIHGTGCYNKGDASKIVINFLKEAKK